MENFNKNHNNITHFYLKILNLCLTDINIYPISNKTDNFLEIHILKRKEKSFFKVGIFRIRIRICYFTKRIRIRIHIKMKRISRYLSPKFHLKNI